MNELDNLIEEVGRDIDLISNLSNLSEDQRTSLKMLFKGAVEIAYRHGKIRALKENREELI